MNMHELLTCGRQAVTPKNTCPDSGENPVTLMY